MNSGIDVFGNKYWRNEKGEFHREDGPAIECASGSRHWYLNGLRHRTDGPAAIHADGDKIWYINGEYHREDGPAIERNDGVKQWFYHNKFIDCKTNEEFLKLIKLRIFW